MTFWELWMTVRRQSWCYLISLQLLTPLAIISCWRDWSSVVFQVQLSLGSNLTWKIDLKRFSIVIIKIRCSTRVCAGSNFIHDLYHPPGWDMSSSWCPISSLCWWHSTVCILQGWWCSRSLGSSTSNRDVHSWDKSMDGDVHVKVKWW